VKYIFSRGVGKDSFEEKDYPMESPDNTLQQLMFSLIEVWMKSGHSRKAFCQDKGLAPGKFQYWYTKYQQSHQPTDGEPFMAVTVRGKPTGTKVVASGSMEVLWPDGRRVIFHQGVEASFLRTLLG
jgi:hypothetical protein